MEGWRLNACKGTKTPIQWLREGYKESYERETEKKDDREQIIELNEGKVDLDNPFYLIKKAYEDKEKRQRRD